jgi:hypothetical protein
MIIVEKPVAAKPPKTIRVGQLDAGHTFTFQNGIGPFMMLENQTIVNLLAGRIEAVHPETEVMEVFLKTKIMKRGPKKEKV